MKAFNMLLVDEYDFQSVRDKIFELRDVIYDGETYPMPVKAKTKLNKQINELIDLINIEET